jgi:hypothetical protein
MPRTTMVVKYFVEIFKSTIRYRTDKKYRYLINGFSFLFFVIIVFIILKTDFYIWLNWFVIPIAFGVPYIATIYLDHYLGKKNK